MISHLAGGEMFGKRVWIAVLFVVTTMGASAVAQAEKNELGGILGRTFISDQGIKGANFFNPIVHSGNGLSFEGEYARRFLMTPVFSLSGEALLMYNHDEDLNAGMNGFAVATRSNSSEDSARYSHLGRTGCGESGGNSAINDAWCSRSVQISTPRHGSSLAEKQSANLPSI